MGIDIIYVGSAYEGNFAAEVAEANGLTIMLTESDSNDLERQESWLVGVAPKSLIIDIRECVGNDAQIAGQTARLGELSQADIIVHAPGYTDSHEIIRSMLIAGIDRFIFAKNLGGKKAELLRHLGIEGQRGGFPFAPAPTMPLVPTPAASAAPLPIEAGGAGCDNCGTLCTPQTRKQCRSDGQYAHWQASSESEADPPPLAPLPDIDPASVFDIQGPVQARTQAGPTLEPVPPSMPSRPDLEANREALYEEIEASLPSGLREESLHADEEIPRRKIAVMGAMTRIGTTTFALQLCRHFAGQGLAACYIEHNDTRYVAALRELYEDARYDEELSRVVYRGLHIYEDPRKINLIDQCGYDVLIYDYGSMAAPGFSLTAALERDAVIAVCGIKPLEVDATAAAIDTLYAHEAPFYAFNHVHAGETREILMLQADKAYKTVFAGYSPDPFIYSPDNDEAFSPIASYRPQTAQARKKRRGWKK
jgi:hypothetical protein